MRKIDLSDTILTTLTDAARAIPDLFLDGQEILVQLTEDAGIFDIVEILSEDEELLVGEIVLDEDLIAHFEIFAD